jgi:hypothetical protein
MHGLQVCSIESQFLKSLELEQPKSSPNCWFDLTNEFRDTVSGDPRQFDADTETNTTHFVDPELSHVSGAISYQDNNSLSNDQFDFSCHVMPECLSFYSDSETSRSTSTKNCCSHASTTASSSEDISIHRSLDRRTRNNMASIKFRARRKKKMEDLEKTIVILEERVKQLMMHMDLLKRENTWLREQQVWLRNTGIKCNCKCSDKDETDCCSKKH